MWWSLIWLIYAWRNDVVMFKSLHNDDVKSFDMSHVTWAIPLSIYLVAYSKGPSTFKLKDRPLWLIWTVHFGPYSYLRVITYKSLAMNHSIWAITSWTMIHCLRVITYGYEFFMVFMSHKLWAISCESLAMSQVHGRTPLSHLPWFIAHEYESHPITVSLSHGIYESYTMTHSSWSIYES